MAGEVPFADVKTLEIHSKRASVTFWCVRDCNCVDVELWL